MEKVKYFIAPPPCFLQNQSHHSNQVHNLFYQVKVVKRKLSVIIKRNQYRLHEKEKVLAVMIRIYLITLLYLI